MKLSIAILTPSGVAYLTHRDKSAFSPPTARKYLRQHLAANPSVKAWTENEFREATPSASRLEARARRLRSLRLVDPRAPGYALADHLAATAEAIRNAYPVTP